MTAFWIEMSILSLSVGFIAGFVVHSSILPAIPEEKEEEFYKRLMEYFDRDED